MFGKKYNSVETTQSDIIKNQGLIIEILTKIDQAVNSSDSFVTVNGFDANGNEVISQVPSISYLTARIDNINNIVKKLSGFDGYPSTMFFSGNGKKIYAIDVNEEPQKLNSFTPVTTFKATPNWIFDTMMNPKISVELDVTDKISQNVKTIISKRFIVEFETMEVVDESGFRSEILTSEGTKRLAEFNSLYNGRNDINVNDFVSWLDRNGIRNKTNQFLIDDDHFKIEPLNINYKGFFTIFGTDYDLANNKLWYIFDTLTYQDLSNGFGNESTLDLKPGVELAVNNSNGTSATIYKVAEISTITSQFRVRLEKVFGEEPVPIMNAGLRIHSTAINSKKVRISVGYDEYSVLFVKPLNDVTHIQAVEWSAGLGFYTNELRLDNSSGELLGDFYTNTVLDYGLVLEELTEKKIPVFYAIKPDAPLLIEENFTIVQTNKHLTNTVDAERIRDLHNRKTNLASEIQQIHNQLEKQNAKIAKTSFSTEAQKKSAQETVMKLNTDLVNKTQTKNTITVDILQNKKNINKISPTYSLRGIFPFPKAKTSDNTKPQEVVQFEIWYRKLSKSGDENQLQTFKDISKAVDTKNTKSNLTAADKAKINNTKNVNATFSNWVKFKTDARKQVYNPDSATYEWEIEDVSDANTPTINQIDIPVEVGESIEIKVRSLSEVGYPEAPIESEFSNTILVNFPENLESILNDDDFILKDATADNIKSEMMKELETMGVNLHLSSQVRDVDVYYPHTANVIASGFKDANGRIINLYDYILSMRNEMTALKEEINRSKGILEMYLMYKNTKIPVYNTNNLSYTIQLEDYLTTTQIGTVDAPITGIARTYKNEVVKITDYSFHIKNIAESALLGLLANRGYGSPAGFYPADFAYKVNESQVIYTGYDERALSGAYVALPTAGTPYLPTQLNNSFLWQQTTNMNSDKLSIGVGAILNTDHSIVFPHYSNTNTLGTRAIAATTNNKMNIGLTGIGTTSTAVAIPVALPDSPISTPIVHYSGTSTVSEPGKEENFTYRIAAAAPPVGDLALQTLGTSVHASVNQLEDLKNESQEKIEYIPAGTDGVISVPISIYARPYTGACVAPTATSSTEITIPSLTGTFGTSGGKMTLDQANLASLLNPGSKVMFINLTGPLTPNTNTLNNTVNGKLITVDSIVGNVITFNVNITFVVDSSNGGTLKQIHILARNTVANGNTPMRCYNVYTHTSFTPVISSYIEVPSGSNPVEHNKSLRFFLEDENQIRPIDFQFNFKIIQHKRQSFGTGSPGTTTPGGSSSFGSSN